MRVNRAIALLGERSLAETVRALRAEHLLSERQARRYVNAAREMPGGGRRPGAHGRVHGQDWRPSLIAALRERAGSSGQTLSATVAEATRLYLDGPSQPRNGRAR